MRELTIRIRFTSPSLGNSREPGGDRLLLPRGASGAVLFMASWHRANAAFAADVICRHQDEVKKIVWAIEVDGVPEPDAWVRRWYKKGTARRFSVHEAFQAGHVVGINCVVPRAISDEDLWRLMTLAGMYKGLSPFRSEGYGMFEVVSIRPRRELPGSKETGPDPDATPDQARSSHGSQE